MWIAWVLLVVLALALYLGRQGKRPRKLAARPVVVRWDGPITTHKDACTALAEVLKRHGRSKKLMGVVLSDFRAAMKEHVEELGSNIRMLKEEVAKQVDYRAEIADEVDGDTEDALAGESFTDEDKEAAAKAQRHLGHLDRELAEMRASLAANQQALKAYKTDRAVFVAAYAAHVLYGKPNPNAGRSWDV